MCEVCIRFRGYACQRRKTRLSMQCLMPVQAGVSILADTQNDTAAGALPDWGIAVSGVRAVRLASLRVVGFELPRATQSAGALVTVEGIPQASANFAWSDEVR